MDIQKFARKHQKGITLLLQIAFLLFLTMIVASLYIGSVSTAEAEIGKWAYPAIKPRVEAPIAPSAKIDPKTGVSITPRKATGNTEPMKALIRRISAELGYTKPEWAIAIATCESGLRSDAHGDHGHSHGMWQIYRPAHPNISEEQAYSAEWSTRWSIEQLLHGRDSMWTCARILSKV